MARVLTLVSGIPRMVEESSSTAIYDEGIEIVSSGAVTGQLNGPITAGTPIALPSGKTYTGDELEVYLDGNRLRSIFEYTFDSNTTVAFTFELLAGDILKFRIDRPA